MAERAGGTYQSFDLYRLDRRVLQSVGHVEGVGKVIVVVVGRRSIGIHLLEWSPTVKFASVPRSQSYRANPHLDKGPAVLAVRLSAQCCFYIYLIKPLFQFPTSSTMFDSLLGLFGEMCAGLERLYIVCSCMPCTTHTYVVIATST